MRGHPANVTGPLWFGIECEGQFSGKRTAFVEEPVSIDAIGDVEHVFLTEKFGSDEMHWMWLRTLVDRIGHRCTIAIGRELHQMHDRERPELRNVHCIARVWLPNISFLNMLRFSDEVSIGLPFNLAVCTNIRQARPKDYASDTGLEPATMGEVAK